MKETLDAENILTLIPFRRVDYYRPYPAMVMSMSFQLMLELSERTKDFLDMSRKESRTFQPFRDFAKATIVSNLHRLTDALLTASAAAELDVADHGQN